jgi:hypothetical protein
MAFSAFLFQSVTTSAQAGHCRKRRASVATRVAQRQIRAQSSARTFVINRLLQLGLAGITIVSAGVSKKLIL